MKLFNFFKFKDKTYNNIVEESVDPLLFALINKESIDRNKALKIPCISSSVSLICDTFATIPFKLYKESIDKKGKKTTVEVQDERVNLINYDTKDTLDGFQFKKAICEDYLLGRGGYAFINKNKNKIESVNYVEDNKITVLTNNDPIFKSNTFLINTKTYKSYQILKLLRNTKDGASGTGLVNEIDKSLYGAYKRILYENNLMETGGNKKGFLKAQTKLDKEGINSLKEAWEKYYSGNSSCVILNNGMEFQDASNTSVENQLNEKSKTFTTEIKDLFHIYTNYDEFIKKAILPISTAFATALNKDFLLEKEKKYFYFAPDLSELVKGSIKERYESYKIAIDSGFITRNEVRYIENYDELEGLDVINLGLGSVLLNPKTGEIYTPNTDKTKDVNKPKEKEDNEESNDDSPLNETSKGGDGNEE